MSAYIYREPLHIVTHSIVYLFPYSKFATGHEDTHFLFTESLNLFCGHVFEHVLLVVSEKYPVGQLVTHFPVKGFEKYPVGHTYWHTPHCN